VSDVAVTILTLEQVSEIIAKAQSSDANPMLMGMQLFNGLGNNVTVTGDTLRLAIEASAVPVTDALEPLVTAILSISKTGAHITTANHQKIEMTLNGNRIRFDEEVTCDVGGTPDAPALKNIAGVSAHKLAWIAIKGILLQQNDGRWKVQVTTSVGTVNFNIDSAKP
jgi:hypothetical protein